MTRNSRVPRPLNSSVVEGGNPVSSGTRKVAPNIATTCWAPIPIVKGQVRRSSGLTMASGAMVRPSPCRVQRNMGLPGDLGRGRIRSDGGIRSSLRLTRSEEHTSELQSRGHLVCRLLLEKKKEDV